MEREVTPGPGDVGFALTGIPASKTDRVLKVTILNGRFLTEPGGGFTLTQFQGISDLRFERSLISLTLTGGVVPLGGIAFVALAIAHDPTLAFTVDDVPFSNGLGMVEWTVPGANGWGPLNEDGTIVLTGLAPQ